MLVFWLTLPVANAVWDWLSVGASRGFGEEIRRLYPGDPDAGAGAGRHAWRTIALAVCDGILAVIFLIGLAVTIPWAVELTTLPLRAAGMTADVDLTVYIQSARLNPWRDGLWAMGMLFSTLLPTALHLAMALAALITTACLPRAALNRIASRLERPHQASDPASPALLLIVPVASVALLIFSCLLIASAVNAAFDHVHLLADLLADTALWSLDLARGLMHR